MSAATTPIDVREQRVIRVLAPLSLLHSIVYVLLLVVWLIPGLPGPEFVFGLTRSGGERETQLVAHRQGQFDVTHAVRFHSHAARAQSETERLEAPSEIVRARREIARIKTIQRERERAAAAR